MKTIEFILLILAVMLIGKAFAFTTTTGTGYYSYNGQVVAYYNFTPGVYPDADVTATDTNGTNPSINSVEQCRYYQMHNPSFNMNCS